MAEADGKIRIKVDLDSADAEREMQGLSGKLSGTLKSGLATAAKVGAASLAAAAAGVAKLTEASMEQYAEYEQLVGGVETLFKDSADIVMGYAENAYKTAGLSANEYMNTVTSFSASLLQSLDGDTKAAAEKANVAITDMSDNANKMGTAMESIQNAYQGFAKQNFTMLDNLKLGYGGTKEEMERLLEDAEKLSGIKYDISSYSDIVDAIHVIQTEIGITGTTAKEASTTIQGSVNAMKSAWTNLLTGIADENADVDSLVNNLVESTSIAAQNIMPRVEQILSGIGELIAKLAPTIANEIPTLISNVLPNLLQAGGELIAGVSTGIGQALPELLKCALEAILTFADGLSESIPQMLPSVIEIITETVSTLIEHADELLAASIAIIAALAVGLIKSIPSLIEAVPKLVEAIVRAFSGLMSKIVDIGKNLVRGIWEGIAAMASWLWQKVSNFFSGIVNGVKNLLGIHSPSRVFAGIGRYMMEGLANGVDGSAKMAINSTKNAIRSIESAASFGIPLHLIPNVGDLRLPRLAQGAVIPPNREFLSVLGDQKHGTNVEAPLETIQQAVVQAFASMGPELGRAIVQAFTESGTIGNIRASEDYSRVTAQKECSLGKPSRTAGRWVSQSLDAYDAVRG